MIDRNSYIEDLVRDHPEIVVPLAEYGIVCIACGEPVWGTLGDLMDNKELQNQVEIIENINRIVSEKNA